MEEAQKPDYEGTTYDDDFIAMLERLWYKHEIVCNIPSSVVGSWRTILKVVDETGTIALNPAFTAAADFGSRVKKRDKCIYLKNTNNNNRPRVNVRHNGKLTKVSMRNVIYFGGTRRVALLQTPVCGNPWCCHPGHQVENAAWAENHMNRAPEPSILDIVCVDRHTRAIDYANPTHTYAETLANRGNMAPLVNMKKAEEIRGS